MTKKFDLIDFGEDIAKDISEIMSNKTCRKILDFLREKESTETEISDNLNIALSTVHYNIQKLIKVGLIEIKDFYWSPKGNKVYIYKASNKLFVFPQRKSIHLENKLRMILPLIAIISLAIILTILILYPKELDKTQVKKFNSLVEIKDFIKENTAEDFGVYTKGTFGTTTLAGFSSGSTTSVAENGAVDFSKTNVQVEGVDEADIVKNDGEYIYTVSGNNVIIVEAYPAEDAEILSEIEVGEGVNGIFLNDNKLTIFVSNSNQVNTLIYDVSDKEYPILERNISTEGNYIGSRMIEDYVYIILSKNVNIDNIVLPVYKINGIENSIEPWDIYYFDMPDRDYSFTSIISINLKEDEFESKVYLTGATQNIYVSLDNIYLTNTKTMSWKVHFERIVDEVFLTLLPSTEKEKVEYIKILISQFRKNGRIFLR